MGVCIVDGCNNRTKGNINRVSFHRIRSEDRDIWLASLNMQGKPFIRDERVCSKHFEEKWLMKRLSKVFLRQGAIPTLYPSNKEKQLIQNEEIKGQQQLVRELQNQQVQKSNVLTEKVTSLSNLHQFGKHVETIIIMPQNEQKETKEVAKLRKELYQKNKKIKVLQQKVRRLTHKVKAYNEALKSLENKIQGNLFSKNSSQPKKQKPKRPNNKPVAGSAENTQKNYVVNVSSTNVNTDYTEIPIKIEVMEVENVEDVTTR